jgi:hypothetical protein
MTMTSGCRPPELQHQLLADALGNCQPLLASAASCGLAPSDTKNRFVAHQPLTTSLAYSLFTETSLCGQFEQRSGVASTASKFLR